jgi:Asp-tRNA(Asn)/Glu-tRNA(Gln) amidotransferase A subunit family amidase
MSTSHAVTRSVRDSAALLDAVAGPELGSPYWAPPQQRPYLEEVGADPGRLRIAVQTESWNGAPTAPECRRAAEAAGELCAGLGHGVEAVSLSLGELELGRATQIVIGSNVRVLVEQGAAALGREPRTTWSR